MTEEKFRYHLLRLFYASYCVARETVLCIILCCPRNRFMHHTVLTGRPFYVSYCIAREAVSVSDHTGCRNGYCWALVPDDSGWKMV